MKKIFSRFASQEGPPLLRDKEVKSVPGRARTWRVGIRGDLDGSRFPFVFVWKNRIEKVFRFRQEYFSLTYLLHVVTPRI